MDKFLKFRLDGLIVCGDIFKKHIEVKLIKLLHRSYENVK